MTEVLVPIALVKLELFDVLLLFIVTFYQALPVDLPVSIP
jgi:hypothetical protein